MNSGAETGDPKNAKSPWAVTLGLQQKQCRAANATKKRKGMLCKYHRYHSYYGVVNTPNPPQTPPLRSKAI
jgi:hypothetical protein